MKTLTKTTLALLIAASALNAQDPKEMTDPTSWLWRHGQTKAQLDTLQSSGWRIIDIRVEQSSPIRFSAALVKSSGKYAASRAWYYGPPNVVKSKVEGGGYRMTSISPYVVNNAVHLAVACVKNSGSNAKTWQWRYGLTQSQISSTISNFGGRLQDVDSYVVGGQRRYALVQIKNSGSDYRPWRWYVGWTMNSIISNLGSGGPYRLYSLRRRSDGRYNAVALRNVGSHKVSHWWYYSASTESTLNTKWRQNGARIYSIDSFKIGNTKYHAALMVNNSNALSTEIGDILRAGTNGKTGLYLRRIGGSTLASLQSGEQFEPASTVKVLPHVHAMRRVRLGTNKLNEKTLVYTGSIGSCPIKTGPKTETLEFALRRMMVNSDNNRTQAVIDKFGRININATATALGMTKTKLNHVIGCGSAALANPNRVTLRDLSILHEKVAGGYLGSQREKFYEIMLESITNYPTWGSVKASTIVDQEAAKLGLTLAQRNGFKALMKMAYKAGSYTLTQNGKTGYYLSIFGWMKLPFRSGSVVTPREYTTGVFGEKASNQSKLASTLNKAATELLRDEIRKALATWKGYHHGVFAKIGSGCKGSNAKIATLNGFGQPDIGLSAGFASSGARGFGIGLFSLGFSKTKWGVIPLPLHLAFAGASGCRIYTEPTIQFGILHSALGSKKLSLPLPNNKDLVGKSFYSQVWNIDKNANQLGLTFSNALSTTIGGIK